MGVEFLMMDHNWNIAHGQTGHPMEMDHHCYLMHHLYDHVSLSLEKLLGISRFWLDISVTHSHEMMEMNTGNFSGS